MALRPEFVYIFIIGILVMALVYSNYPVFTRESFHNLSENKGYPVKCKMPLTVLPQLSGPADSTLSEARVPYHLLGDYLPPAEGRVANLKSECAYVADGQRLIEKTGTYCQVTNNYKKAKPDNGSTLLRELSLSFYK